MKITGQDKYLLSDTLVPDIFIQEYMPKLGHAATKCYLLLLSAFQNGKREIDRKDLSLRLSHTPKEIDLALVELVEAELIILEQNGIKLSDLKAIEIRTLLENQQSSQVSILSPEIISEREQVVTAINNEYFQGLMTHAWYNMIDNWFLKYQFEPAVVQALFAEATASDKWGRLNRPFLNAIADRWAKHKIRTFSELSDFYEENEKFLAIYRHVCKELRIPSNAPSMRLVESWVYELGFDLEVISLALENSAGSSNPLNYADATLKRWHDKNLQSAADVKKEQKEWQGSRKQSRRSSMKASNRGNYAGSDSFVDYNAAFGLKYPKIKDETDEIANDDEQ